MLRWPAGPRASDGVWAPAWYDQVLVSTGFGPPRSRWDQLDDRLKKVAEAARRPYEHLSRHRVTIGSPAAG